MIEKSTLLVKQENLELTKENTALKETVTKLLEEVERLRNLPTLNTSVQKVNQTTEQRIIEEQIQIYQQLSFRGPLSLDDIRALDILIKNKRLLDQNKAIEPDWKDISENTSENELLRLAGDVEVKKSKRNKSKTGSKDTVE
jgi:hypothetical protein